MRISDWSSDVCSSDLPGAEWPRAAGWCGFLNPLRAARNSDDARAGDFCQSERLHQLDKGVQLVGRSRSLEKDRAVGGIDRLRTDVIGDPDGREPLIAGCEYIHADQLTPT